MKKTRAELKPPADGRPGHALLVLTGWDPASIEIGAQAEVCVQRNQDQRYLGDGRQWTGTQTWHSVAFSSETAADAVILSLDPVVVDPLVENTQMTYQVQIRIGAEQGIGVIRIREGVLSSHAAGQSVSPVTILPSTPAVQMSPVSDPTPIEPFAPEPIAHAQTPKKSSKLPLIGVGALLLLVAAYFAWTQFKNEPVPLPVVTPTVVTPVVVAPAPAPVVPAAPLPCSAEALVQVKDDLAFIQSCLKTNPDSTQVLSVIATAKKNNRCELAQRLFAFKGQSGDIPVALAYAKEFDPSGFVAGCVQSPDKETAIYWYEIVLSKDPNNAEAKSRLDALRK